MKKQTNEINYKIRPEGLEPNPKWWLWQRGLHEWELRKRHMLLGNDSTLWSDQMEKITREVDNNLGCFPNCRPSIQIQKLEQEARDEKE